MKRILEENLAGGFHVALACAPRQGLDLALTLDVCPSPTCDCRQVHVTCPDPANENASLRFTVSLDDNALAEVSDHGQVPFLEAVVDALSEADWARLQAAYLSGQGEGYGGGRPQPPRGDVPSGCPQRRLFRRLPRTDSQRHAVPVRDRRTDRPDSGPVQSRQRRRGPEVLLQVEFYRGEPGVQVPDVALGAYDYARKQVLVAHGLPKSSFREAFDKLRQRVPELDQVFALRHERVKALYALAKARHTPIRAVRIGRNELCPCGSGRKYKRCCCLV